MSVTHRTRSLAIILATATLILGYGLGNLWTWAVLLGVAAVIWWWTFRLRWNRIPCVALTAYVLAAAAGCWLGLQPIIIVIGVVFALCAWDLDHFARRLTSVKPDAATRMLERRHLGRLAVVSGLGTLLAQISLNASFKLSFATLLILSLLAALGLSRTFAWLRRASE